MNRTRETINVYRFGDRVAITPPDGRTFYLTADQARLVADALMACCDSINTEKFTDSNFGTRTISVDRVSS